jgi:hypothetical protein
MRLAGLYTEQRGPHTFWMKAGEVDGDPDGTLNMLHYSDAAAAAIGLRFREPTYVIIYLYILQRRLEAL